MHRTPAKSAADKEGRISVSPQEQQKEQLQSSLNTTKTLSVRRSVGEWESVKTSNSQHIGRTQAPVCGASTESSKTPPKKVTSKSRADEARLCHNKAKMCLSSSRNLKTDLKHDIVAAVERLFQLVKEAEADLSKARSSGTGGAPLPRPSLPQPSLPTYCAEKNLTQQLEVNSKLLRENIDKMEELKNSMELQKAATYASAVAGKIKLTPKKGALHSVVVTSRDEMETGEEVLEKIRKALDAKEGWVRVERVRKAKDRKVIMGFETTEERDKARRRIERDSALLSVEEVRNKDPLLVLKDVLIMHSDDDVLRALRNQNPGVFHGLDEEANRITIKFRKKTRNPHTGHIVLTVSPSIWGRATEQGRLRIDLQNVFVEDQSPLVQCSKCLGYGHGRRFCKVPADLCSHCGGPHLSIGCPDKVVGEAPTCVNCKRAGSDKISHNAFSGECPVRKKWDSIARASIQYC